MTFKPETAIVCFVLIAIVEVVGWQWRRLSINERHDSRHGEKEVVIEESNVVVVVVVVVVAVKDGKRATIQIGSSYKLCVTSATVTAAKRHTGGKGKAKVGWEMPRALHTPSGTCTGKFNPS